MPLKLKDKFYRMTDILVHVVDPYRLGLDFGIFVIVVIFDVVFYTSLNVVCLLFF